MSPIVWIGVCLAIVEVGLEVRAYLRGWDTILFGAVRTEGTQSSSFGPSPDFPFRGPIVPELKPADATRIWIASASHGEDNAFPADSIFPSLIVDEMRRRGVPTQVLNASKAGETIEENLAFLEDEFGRWQPDVVVLYQLSMDISVLARRFLAPGAVLGQPGAGEGGGPAWPTRLLEQTTTYTLLDLNVTTRLEAAQLLADDIGPNAREAFRLTLVEFIESVRGRGARPVLCTFATSFSPKAPGPIPIDVVRFVHAWNDHLSVRGWLAAVESFNDVIGDVARQEGVLLVDAETFLTGKDGLFRDPVHFSRSGHLALASTIASALAGDG